MPYTVKALHCPSGKIHEWSTDDAYAAKLLCDLLKTMQRSECPTGPHLSDWIDVELRSGPATSSRRPTGGICEVSNSPR